MFSSVLMGEDSKYKTLKEIVREEDPKCKASEEIVREEDAKYKASKEIVEYDYVRFTFTDLNGVARGRTVPGRHVARFLDTGVGINIGLSPGSQFNLSHFRFHIRHVLYESLALYYMSRELGPLLVEK